jgi:hypothetical protein
MGTESGFLLGLSGTKTLTDGCCMAILDEPWPGTLSDERRDEGIQTAPRYAVR